MGITWEEAEVAAQNRSEWRQSVAQCIHLDAGWIKVKVKVSDTVNSRKHNSVLMLMLVYLSHKGPVKFWQSIKTDSNGKSTKYVDAIDGVDGVTGVQKIS